MGQAAYLTPEEAIIAFVRLLREDAQKVELVYVETDGRWAVGEVTYVVEGASEHYSVFVLNREEEGGWTARGGGGGGGGGGGSGLASSWVLAPGRGEPGHDGRKGVAVFSMDLPPNAEELRVHYRTRHLSPRRRVKTVVVGASPAFITIWDCHSTWGTTRIDVRRFGRWEGLDSRSDPFHFEPLRERIRSWWQARHSQDGWFQYPSESRRDG